MNLNGEVVGINTAIATSTGGYQGLGFAVPINVAKWVAAQLTDTGAVARAWLGVEIQDVDADTAAGFDLSTTSGVVVTRVVDESPAAEAGVEVGDVIVGFGGRPIDSRSALIELAQQAPIGSRQSVSLIRKGRPSSVEVKVRAMPQQIAVDDDSPSLPGESSSDELFKSEEYGFEAIELTAEEARQNRVGNTTGVYIRSVDREGPAARSLTAGARIARVGDTEITTINDLALALDDPEVRRRGLLMLLETPRGNRYVMIRR